MSALSCDICGGSLVMSTGATAVCSSCGMAHSSERVQEKVQVIQGTVRIDTSHLEANFLEMARYSADSGNMEEAEKYCTKVLESSPSKSEAWFIKGRAAGWQSTLDNFRILEAAQCFSRAYSLSEEEEKSNLAQVALEELTGIGVSLIDLRAMNLVHEPTFDVVSVVQGDLERITSAIETFINVHAVPPIGVLERLATAISEAGWNAYRKTIRPTWNAINKPKDSDWRRYIDGCLTVKNIIRMAIDLSQDDYEADIARYRMLQTVTQDFLHSKSFTSEGLSNLRLSNDDKNLQRRNLYDYNSQIRRLQKIIQDETRRRATELADEYWTNNPAEHKALQSKLGEIGATIDSLRSSLANAGEKSTLSDLRKSLSELDRKIQKTGIFQKALKRELEQSRKLISAEISQVTSSINTMERTVTRQISELQQQERALNEKLLNPLLNQGEYS